MTRAWWAVVVAAGLAGAASPARAQQLDEAALAQILETAKALCGEFAREGFRSSSAVEGTAEAELAGLAGRLVELGVEGAGRIEASNYANVLQEQLGEELRNQRECNLRIWNDLRSLVAAPAPAAPRPAAKTGRLGLLVAQGGAPVGVGQLQGWDPAALYYAYQVELAPEAFELVLPARYCGPAGPDTRTAGVGVRVLPADGLGALEAAFGASGVPPLDAAFPGANAYAGPMFTLTELLFEEPSAFDGLFGFNYFVDDRFAAWGDDSVTVLVNRVENLATGEDLLAEGQPFLLLIGAYSAQCSEGDAPAIELLRIEFG
jgi:hypothetical protein